MARPKPNPRRIEQRARSSRVRRVVAAAIAAALIAIVAWFALRDREDLRARAERAERAGRHSEALELRREWIRSGRARSRDRVALARSALAVDRAREAESALREAVRLDPAEFEAWHLLIELLRIERRELDAESAGIAALEAVPTDRRTGILRDLTLATIYRDTTIDARSETIARRTLERWIASDPEDDDARAALALRQAIDPIPGDPDRDLRIAELEARLAVAPEHRGLREALIVSLADAGEIDRGRALLDAWPAGDDPRRDRLRARFDLDYDRKPEEAAEALGRVVARIPHDWRSHYHRARALRAVGRIDDANRAADMARRLRERLDPARLAARLVEDLREPVRSPALRDLAELCRELGLSRLAEEWERLAARRGSNPT